MLSLLIDLGVATIINFMNSISQDITTKNNNEALPSKGRILYIDFLRAGALFGILISHILYQFSSAPEYPEAPFFWIGQLDKMILMGAKLIVSGKAMSIFSFLFGVSFFIQLQSKKMTDTIFLWRLILLFIIGYLHGLFYENDILKIYAVLGMFLIPLYKLSTKYLIFILIILLIQPVLLLSAINDLYFNYSFSVDNIIYLNPLLSGSWNSLFALNSAWDGAQFNSFFFTMKSYRSGMIFSLFLLGILYGRSLCYVSTDFIKKIRIKYLFISFLLSFIFLSGFFIISDEKYITNNSFYNFLLQYLKLYINLPLSFIALVIIMFIFDLFKSNKIIFWLINFGRQGLTMYVFQSIIGVFIYYQCGLGLYKFMGPTFSLMLGILIYMVLVLFSNIWMKYFLYGPLEYIWRCSTYRDFSIPFRKRENSYVKN